MQHIENIKSKISAKKLTIEEVAKKANITRAHMYAVLRGSSPITAHIAIGFETALGINARRLYLTDAAARFDALKGVK